MPPLRLASLAFLPSLTLLVACQSALAAPGGARPDRSSAGLLPPATRAIEVRPAVQENDNLAYLVDQLAAATGTVFAVSPTVRDQMRKTPTGLAGDLIVAPAEGWSWVESLLAQGGYRLSVVTTRPPHVLTVLPNLPHPGVSATPRYLWIDGPADLALLEEHPALLVTCSLELPYTDVRQLGNSLRGLWMDPSGYQTVLPVGNSNSVILSGTGAQVLDLARILRQVNEAEQARVERAPPADPATQGQAPRPPG